MRRSICQKKVWRCAGTRVDFFYKTNLPHRPAVNQVPRSLAIEAVQALQCLQQLDGLWSVLRKLGPNSRYKLVHNRKRFKINRCKTANQLSASKDLRRVNKRDRTLSTELIKLDTRHELRAQLTTEVQNTNHLLQQRAGSLREENYCPPK